MFHERSFKSRWARAAVQLTACLKGAACTRFRKLVALTVCLSTLVFAGGGPDDKGTNGQHRRPLYIIGHNPNELSNITAAFDAGANALEPDIMKFADGAKCPVSNGDGSLNLVSINARAGASGLFMYHDDVLLTTRCPVTIEDYFDVLHSKAVNGTNVALIVLDIKTPAAVADLVLKLQTAVNTHLNYGGIKVNMIYNVADFADADAAFSKSVNGQKFLAITLGDNEGLNIDGTNDPVGVANYLSLPPPAPTPSKSSNSDTTHGLGALHYGYGNGSFGVSMGFAPSVVPTLDLATWIRASQVFDINRFANGGTGFGFSIPYAFPIPVPSTLANDLIAAGVDGLISDADEQPQDFDDTVKAIKAFKEKIDADNDHYVATAADNPWYIPVEAYALRIQTDTGALDGTSDTITFTLTGSCGTSSVSYNADYSGRLGAAAVNYVTIPSKNLGLLSSLKLDSSGSNNWHPSTINVTSVRWGIPYPGKQVNFGGDAGAAVKNGSPQSRGLDGVGRACDTTPPNASPTQAPAANSYGWDNMNVTVNWNWADANSGVAYGRCTTSSTSSGEGSGITLNANCNDYDGNVGSASYVVKVDKTAPTVTCGSPDGNWHASDISISCPSSDSLSGLVNSADATLSLTTSVPANTETSNASTNSYTVFDKAGNSTTRGPIAGNKVDKKPPVISIVQPAAVQYLHSATLTLNYSATDAGSGVKTTTATIDGNSTVEGNGLGSGQAINLLTALSLGQHTLKIDTVDNVGNTSSSSVTFSIIVNSQSMIDDIYQFSASGAVKPTNGESLLSLLDLAKDANSKGRCQEASEHLKHFIKLVQDRTGSSITPTAAAILIADANYLMQHCPA